jgi:NAD(P)-dependent dehydrogenase (short-subunit alcohol dehydrogenase family)
MTDALDPQTLDTTGERSTSAGEYARDPAVVRRPRTVLVTGGASGLGAAVVRALATRGDRPLVLDLAPVSGHPSIAVDLSDGRAAEQAVSDLLAEHAPDGRLDGVVAAAGTDACGRLGDVDAKSWDRVVAVNLLGVAAVVRAALPALTTAHGRVVTVASTLGLKAVSDATAYCASKFGLVGFTRALAVELSGSVGVTLVVPGGMSTAFFDGRPDQYKPGPDARLADPGDIAAGILFALDQPPGTEVREIVMAVDTEPSWP